MAYNWTTKTIADYPGAVFAVVTGDDTLGNGLVDTPYRSINKAGTIAGTGPIVLGTGGYTGTSYLGTRRTIAGEYLKGKQTVINLNGGTLDKGLYYDITLNDLTIKNGSVSLHCENTNGVGTFNRITFIDCIINNDSDNLAGVYNYNDCEFINCTLSNTFRMKPRYIRCKFFNTTSFNQKSLSVGFGCTLLESSYVDSFSKIEFNTEANITEINFNDIEGQLKFQDGTNPDVYVGLAQALSEHPLEVGSNNINANPLFADVSKMALTVSNSSPLIGASKTGNNIGNAFRADTYFCQISPQLRSTLSGGTALIAGMDGTTDLTVTPGFFVGTIRTGVFPINTSAVSELGAIQYIGKYALDSSLGGTSNSQVPDASGYTGISPNNLSYKLRYSTGSTPPSPTVNGDWDNGGLIAAGEFFDMVWNIQPQIDGANRGNADEAFESATASIVACKWVQLEINIIEDSWNN